MSDSTEGYPQFQRLATTKKIDLHIIQQQLDRVEDALLMAYHQFLDRQFHEQMEAPPKQVQQLSEAMDTLLAVKKSFGLVSALRPIEVKQSAIIRQEEASEQ